MAYSVIGEDFRIWVKDLVTERNEDITNKKQLMISMDPDIAAAFSASTAVSSKYFFVFSMQIHLMTNLFYLV